MYPLPGNGSKKQKYEKSTRNTKFMKARGNHRQKAEYEAKELICVTKSIREHLFSNRN